MAAITQLIPNFLGGVSKQNDDRKLEGQVSECINGYPDPTYGLLKRPGMKFIDKLKNDVGAPFNKAALDGAVWTFIDRGAQGSYVAAIKGSAIYAWTTDGQWCTVTNTGTAYLTGTSANDYHFRSIQDTTIITNKKIDVTPHTQLHLIQLLRLNCLHLLKLLSILLLFLQRLLTTQMM
jgi:hypothetical protein